MYMYMYKTDWTSLVPYRQRTNLMRLRSRDEGQRQTKRKNFLYLQWVDPAGSNALCAPMKKLDYRGGLLQTGQTTVETERTATDYKLQALH